MRETVVAQRVTACRHPGYRDAQRRAGAATCGVVVLALFLLACGGSDPYCSEFVDATGRAVAYCPSPRDEPVCDLPDERAHFEETPTGIVLSGGRRASCDEDFQVVCPREAVGAPYCIRSLDPP